MILSLVLTQALISWCQFNPILIPDPWTHIKLYDIEYICPFLAKQECLWCISNNSIHNSNQDFRLVHRKKWALLERLRYLSVFYLRFVIHRVKKKGLRWTFFTQSFRLAFFLSILSYRCKALHELMGRDTCSAILKAWCVLNPLFFQNSQKPFMRCLLTLQALPWVVSKCISRVISQRM